MAINQTGSKSRKMAHWISTGKLLNVRGGDEKSLDMLHRFLFVLLFNVRNLSQNIEYIIIVTYAQLEYNRAGMIVAQLVTALQWRTFRTSRSRRCHHRKERKERHLLSWVTLAIAQSD